jgi:ribosome-associated protein
MDILKSRDFSAELRYSASRSSGPGGQNVNKVSTKVELRFSVISSFLLSDEEKKLLVSALASRINEEGELILVCQRERSQSRNRDLVTERFYSLLVKALTPAKKRRPTVPTHGSVEKRLSEKRRRSEAKSRRKEKEQGPADQHSAAPVW